MFSAPDYLQAASSLFGVGWEIERFLSSGVGNGKNSILGGQKRVGGGKKNTKNWGMTLPITEKNTGLVLWTLVS